MFDDIIFDNDASRLADGGASGRLAHLMCREGRCVVHFNNRECVIGAGDAAIFRATHLITRVEVTDNAEIKAVYINPAFIEQAAPANNYGIKGSLMLFDEPVMHLLPHEWDNLWDDFCDIEKRLSGESHNFYIDVMRNKVQMMILDFFDCHIRISNSRVVQNSDSSLMYRFHQMLERGDYREYRRVDYYASELCVVPKYLSEVSTRVCGFPASYWINRYAAMELNRLLRDKSLSLSDIADMFHFSSAANFSRYVQRHLGMSPSTIRNSVEV